MLRYVLLLLFGFICFGLGIVVTLAFVNVQSPEGDYGHILPIDWTRLSEFLQEDANRTIIFALGVALVSLAGFISLFVLLLWKQEVSTPKRPYFRAIEAGIRELPDSPPYRLHVLIENAGEHDASELDAVVMVLDTALGSEPYAESDFRILYAIPAGSTEALNYDAFELPSDMPRQYVIAALRYLDAVSGEAYSQQFVWEWRGVENRECYPDFGTLNGKEERDVREHVRERLAHFAS